MTVVPVEGKARRGVYALVWLGVNVALSFCAYVALVSLWLLGYLVRTKAWHSVAAPYQDAEAPVGAVIAVVGSGLVAAIAVLVNRALRRRLGLNGWQTFVFWILTALVILIPFGYDVVTSL